MQSFYQEAAVGGFSDVDGTVRFYTRVHALAREHGAGLKLLDIGCGRGEFCDDNAVYRRELRNFRSIAERVIGIDVDRAGETNPTLDEFRLIQGGRWPVASGSVEICLADWVMEHVADPAVFLAECHRVLKPGGHLCLRTLNRHSYVGIAARLIPNRLHNRVLKYAQDGRETADIFPTLYRCNTHRALRTALAKSSLQATVYAIESEPSYLECSKAAYMCGVLYQRYAPASVRTTLLAFGQKAIDPNQVS